MKYSSFVALSHKIPLKEACESCGSKIGLQRHHENYEDPYTFKTLCRKCHKKEQAKSNFHIQDHIENEFHNTCIWESTYEKVRFLAQSQGKSISQFLDDLICPSFQVGMNFRNANMESCISILSSTVTFTFSGKSTFTIGHCSEEELANLKHRLFTEAQTEIHKKAKKKVVKK